MKVNLYYRTVEKRTNKIQEAFLNFFLEVSSWPKLLLEVFLRSRMGERSFSFSGTIAILFILGFAPIIAAKGFHSFSPWNPYQNFGREEFSLLGFLWRNVTWYLFLTVFLLESIKRQEEIKRLPSVFDFGRYSLSSGDIRPFFYKIRIGGKPADVRTIETMLEPALFFVVGLVLWLFGQNVGALLLVCSIFYSLSYMGAYYKGDQFIMDMIDELICSEELVNAYVEGRSSNETRGVNFYGRRPADPEMRKQLVSNMIHDQEIAMAI